MAAENFNFPAMSPASCDIFCNVIDNYGDIGVSWRLARQLANEHSLAVRLWVDDLGSLAKMCPEVDVEAKQQMCRSVELCHWTADAFFMLPQPLFCSWEGGAAELVIEAFACKLPQSYIEAMVAQQKKPVWVNLEHLSAEDWVEGCHKLPSPHPALPLTKYFFFPGFTKQTGGLLLEHDLLVRRDAFQSEIAQQQAFWESIGMEAPAAETLKISLFAYETPMLFGLLDALSGGTQLVLCLVPEGRILPQIGQYFGAAVPRIGDEYARGNLRVRVLSFMDQEHYDELLWSCDVNFVRGEDSFVRALWAGKPFVWQIYPQQDKVHIQKLKAFLALYDKHLTQSARHAVQGWWEAWNIEDRTEQAWPAFLAASGELERHTQHWTQQLAENNLALNLLDFYKEIGRMRALENEGQ